MRKRKCLRIIAIIFIVAAFLLEGIYHFKIEPADRTPTLQSNITEDKKSSKKEQKTKEETQTQKTEQTTQEVEETEKSAEEKQAEEVEVPKAQVDESSDSSTENKEHENEKQDTITCTIEILCSTITDTEKVTNSAIIDYIPKDGIILAKTKITLNKGSSVYDALQEAAKQYGIQVESKYTPLYQNYYIEGIGYIYEFDAGALSGWKYQVNGTFPNYGCSSYQVADGDQIVWCYTCDMGKDIGGSN